MPGGKYGVDKCLGDQNAFVIKKGVGVKTCRQYLEDQKKVDKFLEVKMGLTDNLGLTRKG